MYLDGMNLLFIERIKYGSDSSRASSSAPCICLRSQPLPLPPRCTVSNAINSIGLVLLSLVLFPVRLAFSFSLTAQCNSFM